AELIDEGIFKIDKNGLKLTAADRAMVAVVDLRIPATAFDELKVENEVKLPLNLANFISILKRASSRDKLIMELSDGKLKITIKNSSTRSFTLPLLEISEEEIPPIEQLQFKATVSLKSDVLEEGIEDASIVADSVVFEATPTSFGMKASGEISSTELSLEKGNEALGDLKVEESVKARYPLDYLKKMIKAAKIADTVTLHWSTDYPMKLEFKALDKAAITFVLAPRVAEGE
ncbi:MAG TPA: proliferating cell nuclear antigen (pcna), partial [Candidatus Aenigmarchaeota archaeon]|nr:proliferating cell nuclear antigen (pcna) [Candidatus Aenigmarchaeota archaeon]